MSTSADLVETREQLIRYFESGAKPREQWRVGTEYEKITVSAHDGRALPYSGPRGVEQILRRLAERYGYEPDEEQGRVVGLKRRTRRDHDRAGQPNRAFGRAVRDDPLRACRVHASISNS